MRTVLFIDADENNQEKADIVAYSNEKAGAFIWAKTMEGALQKYGELQPKMLEAAKEWKPEASKEEPKQESIEESLQEINRFYNQNKTIKMIGCSSFYTYVIPGGEANEEFEDILNAYSTKKDFDFYEMFIAFFALGFIWGQRKERQRRRGIK